MKYVGCPVCDEVFETIGFRPMTFQCPQCGTTGQWYAGELDGEPRGFIDWSPCIDYIDSIMWPYLQRILSYYDYFCYAVRQAQETVINTQKAFQRYCEECITYLESQISGDPVADLEISFRMMFIFLVFEMFVETVIMFLMEYAELAALIGAVYTLLGYCVVTLREAWIIAGDLEDDLSSNVGQDVKKENQEYSEQGFREFHAEAMRYYCEALTYITIINEAWKKTVRQLASTVEELANFGPTPPPNPFRYY